MTASRGMCIRSTADTPKNLEDIRNADMNELAEIPHAAFGLKHM